MLLFIISKAKFLVLEVIEEKEVEGKKYEIQDEEILVIMKNIEI